MAKNDNPAIDAVVKKFAEIADETGCSVNLEHHIRKTNGNQATVDDGRGASSLVGAARSIEVLNKMTPAEAEKLGLDQHWRYLYVDDGKANMAPWGSTSGWTSCTAGARASPASWHAMAGGANWWATHS